MSEEPLSPPPGPSAPSAEPPPLPTTVADPARYTESSAGAFGALIPANNPHALWSYYLGIFSLVPILGILMGVTAIVFGVSALKRFNVNPEIRGRTHAIVGIVAAVVCIAVQSALAVAIGMIGAGR